MLYASLRITALIYCLTCVRKKGRFSRRRTKCTAHHQVKTKNSLKLNKDDFALSHIKLRSKVYDQKCLFMWPYKACHNWPVEFTWMILKRKLGWIVCKLQLVHFQYLVEKILITIFILKLLKLNNKEENFNMRHESKYFQLVRLARASREMRKSDNDKIFIKYSSFG